MIDARPNQKPTVRGDILLVTLAATEELRTAKPPGELIVPQSETTEVSAPQEEELFPGQPEARQKPVRETVTEDAQEIRANDGFPAEFPHEQITPKEGDLTKASEQPTCDNIIPAVVPERQIRTENPSQEEVASTDFPNDQLIDNEGDLTKTSEPTCDNIIPAAVPERQIRAGSPSQEVAAPSTIKQAQFTSDRDEPIVTKQLYDYLRDRIPVSEDCIPHLRICYSAIKRMSVYTGSVSTSRRTKLERIRRLTGGCEVRPPVALLRRLLNARGVDARELDSIVQRSLLVTEDQRRRAEAWLARLAGWLRRILRSDSEGKSWLARAAHQIERQRENRGGANATKKG